MHLHVTLIYPKKRLQRFHGNKTMLRISFQSGLEPRLKRRSPPHLRYAKRWGISSVLLYNHLIIPYIHISCHYYLILYLYSLSMLCFFCFVLSVFHPYRLKFSVKKRRSKDRRKISLYFLFFRQDMPC